MGWFNSVVKDIGDAAEDVGDAVVDVVDVVDTVVDGVEDAANTVADGVTDAANAVSSSFTSAATSAWKATSKEALAIGTGVEAAGIVIGDSFLSGANVVADGIEDGAEVVGDGLVSLGKYVSSYACDIALGSALSAAFVALAADGEEEVSMASLAALGLTNFVDTAALNTAAKTLAYIIVEPVYLIPGVSSAVGHKSEMETIIAFLIVTACKEKPELVVSTAGQYLAGVLIYGITHVVCEGEVPGGYEVWQGLQSEITA
ncbi:MAG: hypothetical protein HRU20_02150 [Pseudomonadales bacterium]|nr:hypothetical protein [Pseudomonadales bacterium]